ncbi:hypothetical protein BGX20_005063 [Mortierella sp. AD010]|nr:hypothetical protein BGX20_005063 [Mortierella sp. AD010]
MPQSPHVRNLSSPGAEYLKNPNSLTPPLHPQQQHQLGQKMYINPTGSSNLEKVTRIRNRTISSPAGSFQYSPSSMGSTSASVNMTRPPSGLSFGPMPVRERKRSLLDADMARGLDQVRQSLPGAQLTLDSSHLAAASGASNNNGGNSNINNSGGGINNNGSTEGKSVLHMPFNIKQEPLDQSLVGLGLNGSSPSDTPPEETYHRKRTKSVDMYSSYMGTLSSFTPSPQATNVVPVSMDMSSNVTATLSQGTSVQNWQPPEMAVHLQMYQNNMHLSGLSSAMPPSTMPVHVQMNGPIHPHQMSPSAMGPESSLYIQNVGLPDQGQTLRHSLSHDRLGTGHGILQQQTPGVKAKTKAKATKGSTKSSKVKGRSMSMGDALDPENLGTGEDEDAAQNEEKNNNSGSDFEGSEIHGDRTARKQKLRYEGDQYTPQWVRNTGQAKEGFCDTCSPGKWLQLKNSAFWYHKQFFHGISSVSGKLFSSPVQTRQMEQEDVEGLCHQCNEWIPISNHKRQNSMLWYRHAHKCHIYHKPKTQGQSSNRSSFSAGQPLPTFSEGHPLTQNGGNETAPATNF